MFELDKYYYFSTIRKIENKYILTFYKNQQIRFQREYNTFSIAKRIQTIKMKEYSKNGIL